MHPPVWVKGFLFRLAVASMVLIVDLTSSGDQRLTSTVLTKFFTHSSTELMNWTTSSKYLRAIVFIFSGRISS